MLKKRVMSAATAFILLLCPLTVMAQTDDVDTFLQNAGFPQELIDTMSEPQKAYIYEKSANKNVSFSSYERKEYTITTEGELVENNNISPRGGLLDSSDMTLSVFGTITTNWDGSIYYSVYPCFQWHQYKKVNNDSFAMNLYPGWEAIPGERNFRLHLMNNYGQSAQYVDIAPTNSSSTGYVFKIPTNIGSSQGLYEGYAYYDVNKVTSTATPAISLCYAHDASKIFDASYSLSVGGVGISISGKTNKIYTMADNFYVSGAGWDE